MGCNIHLFAEAKVKQNFIDKIQFWKKATTWKTLDKWELDDEYEPPRMAVPREKRFYTHGRNYNLFCALCGVRSRSFYGNPPRISDPRGIPNDSCIEIINEVKSWEGDVHSHSYNTLEELKSFDWSPYGETVKSFLDEVIPKMEAVGAKDTDVRIVYFFDN